MYILIIHRLTENFVKEEDGIYPNDWDYTTNIAPFTDREDALAYLKQLKTEYHAKGKTKYGSIKGRKSTRYNNEYYYHKTIETIHTELKEQKFSGKELEVASEHDTGECPFSDN